MDQLKKTIFVSSGDRKIDKGLIKIESKIDSKEPVKPFSDSDLHFIEFVLRKKVKCEQCLNTLRRLYLHLNNERMGALNLVEWSIVRELGSRKKELGIPELQYIPTGEEVY